MKMRHPNPDMLLHIALGDAYASCVEYVDRKKHPELYTEALKFERYLQHPSHLKLCPGMYTDDTQMSCAVAQALIDAASVFAVSGNGNDCLTHEAFVELFFRAFKRDPRDGYSRGFQAILEEAKSGDHLRQLIKPDSSKNGAAMRSVPLGIISDPHELLRITGQQAATTHATYGGINSACAVALMSHYALYEHRGFLHMREWCGQYLEIFDVFKRPWDGPVTGKAQGKVDLGVGINTAWAVCTLLEQQKSMMGIMRQVIDWGGDTDSVAAVAWGIAGARYQNEILPEFMARDLEATGNLKYGPDFLRELGKSLIHAAQWL